MNKYNTGKVVMIDTIPESEKLMAIKEFSEGSIALENCLIILNKLGIATRSCCKGQHVSVANNFRDNSKFLDICWNSFIVFELNQDWKSYLSRELLSDPEVIIGDDYVEFYGRDNEGFFRKLGRDFSTGKKNNFDLLASKPSEPTDIMRLQSFVYSLHRIGFNNDQIKELAFLFATARSPEECQKYRERKQELLKEVLGFEDYENLMRSRSF